MGRPTKYKKEYCDALIGHMQKGLSYESFGGVVWVDRDTLYEWEKKHREFSDAKKIGASLCRKWWEEAGIDGMTSGSINAAIWIFNMKNRFPEWRDVKEIDRTNYTPKDKEDAAKRLLSHLREQKEWEK